MRNGLRLPDLQPDRYWPVFSKAMELEDLEHDPRFNSMEARGKHKTELIRLLDEKFGIQNAGRMARAAEQSGLHLHARSVSNGSDT